MDHPPKPKTEGIFAHGLGVKIGIWGVMFGILTLIAYFIGERISGLESGGQTMAFMVLSLSQIVQAYNMRSEHSLFRIGFFGNRTLNLAAMVSLALVALVLLTPLAVPFGLIPLPGKLYAIGMGLALIPLVVVELTKFISDLSRTRK